MRNLQAFIKVSREHHEDALIDMRFENMESLEKYLEDNSDETFKYSLVCSNQFTEQELENYLVKDIEAHQNKVNKVHKIGDLQIFEYYFEEDKNDITFKPYRDYERIGHQVFNNLDDAILYCMISKNIEDENETKYLQKSIIKMLNWN